MSESKHAEIAAISKLVQLKPFRVPNYDLSELDADTLGLLCEEFRRAVFEKAGKVDPDPHRQGG